MKLSEAIRLGAMLTPQARAVTRSTDGGLCSIASAVNAVGQLPAIADDGYLGWHRVLPVALHLWPELDGHLREVIMTKNHSQTREQIADWVETIEAAQAATIEQPVVVTVP